jgi:hypothetical protein
MERVGFDPGLDLAESGGMWTAGFCAAVFCDAGNCEDSVPQARILAGKKKPANGASGRGSKPNGRNFKPGADENRPATGTEAP